MFVSSLPRVLVWVVLVAVLNLSVCVRGSSIQRPDLDQEILYKELDDLQNVVDEAILSDMVNEDSAGSSSAEDPDLSNDLNLLSALLKSAANSESQDLRKSMSLPEGGELMKRRFGYKRGFDSISQNSGFGMHRGSFGGANGGGENLTFTFESLFPAIARGLRSTK